jgi:hypothetical protein
MWDAGGCLQPQPWHHNIIQARPYPIFPTIHPHPYRHNSVRVHPYAHPHHLKLLKHCAYKHICHGWGMLSLGVCSLNHDITTSLKLSHAPIFLKPTPTRMGMGVTV